MTYSFDDEAIGLLSETGRTIDRKSRTIVYAPRGVKRDDWYAFAAQICALLNKEHADHTRESKV